MSPAGCGWQFVDSDRCVEEMTGRSIPDIFREDGEAGFRDDRGGRDRARSWPNRRQVISTGGGAFVNPRNRDALRDGNLVVHLQVRPETVVDRLRNSKSGRPRPLLESADPLGRVIRLMAERKEAYSAAHVTIGVDDRSRYELVGELTRRFLAWQRAHRAPRPSALMVRARAHPRSAARPHAAAGGEVPLLAGPAALEQLPAALAEAGLRRPAVHRRRRVGGGAARCSACSAVLPSAPLLCLGGRRAEQDARAAWRASGTGSSSTARKRRDALVAFGGGVVCDMAGFAAAMLPARDRPGQCADDAARPGRRRRRRQDRHQSSARQEPDRRLLSAAVRRGRHRAAGHAATARVRAGHGRSGQDGDDPGCRPLVSSKRQVQRLAPGDARRARRRSVARSIELKADIVERDERESGDRMLLNYGHTVGHALEAGVRVRRVAARRSGGRRHARGGVDRAGDWACWMPTLRAAPAALAAGVAPADALVGGPDG